MPPDTPRRSLHALPPGTVLHDYVIDSELGSGGFSIVYLARHRLNSDWLFAIKEYLPRELAVRDNDGATVHPVDTEAGDAFQDGLRRFRDEAEQLRKFRNEPYIVSCLNYFEGNGTAYLVMDYDDGLPLSEFLERREAAGQPFTEKDLLAVVEPLLEGLTVVHRAGVLHRDIKPGNIFVRRQDDITGRPAHPVLIDFGAAKQNYLARHSRSRAPYTPGYAAYEQVSSMGEIGPWTDLYSLGAVMWRMVAGGCPDDSRLLVPEELDGMQAEELVWNSSPREVEKRAYALNRGWADPMPSARELGAGSFSSHVLKAVDLCLSLYPEDRVRDCGELAELIRGGGSRQARSEFEPAGGSSTSGSIQDASRGLKPPRLAKGKRNARTGPFPIWWWGVPLVIFTIGAVLLIPEDDTPPGDGLLPIQGQPVEVPVDAVITSPAPERSLDDAIAAYERGDYGVALQEFRNFADQNVAEAQYYLGRMYAEGEGVSEDEAEAIRWYRLAAEQGYASAQAFLGIIYTDNEGEAERYMEGIGWFHLAAEQGDPGTQYFLGLIYANGEGVVEDDVEAVHWFRLAAEQGVSDAQFSLGTMYLNGEGVPKNDVLAVHWWRLAAEQGQTYAQYNLGLMYANGMGVLEDDVEAVRWWRLAAEQGLASAQVHIGIAYRDGEGVAEDLVEAYAWLSIAEAQGDTFARNLKESVAIRMSQSQIEDAQKLSGEYWTMYIEPFL